VVTLNLTYPPPQIIANDGFFGFKGNQFGFNLPGANGQTIIIDRSTNLSNWVPLITNIISTPARLLLRLGLAEPPTALLSGEHARVRARII